KKGTAFKTGGTLSPPAPLPPLAFRGGRFGHELDIDGQEVLLEPGHQPPGELLGQVEEVAGGLGHDMGDQDAVRVGEGDMAPLPPLHMPEPGPGLVAPLPSRGFPDAGPEELVRVTTSGGDCLEDEHEGLACEGTGWAACRQFKLGMYPCPATPLVSGWGRRTARRGNMASPTRQSQLGLS